MSQSILQKEINYSVLPRDIVHGSEGYPTKYKLTIKSGELHWHLTSIIIFDDKFSKVLTPARLDIDTFTREYLLASGNYIVRIEVGNQLSDSNVILNSDKTCSVGMDSSAGWQVLSVPKLYSSALLKNSMIYETSHEYYSVAAVAVSCMNTFKPNLEPFPNTGLFLFLRYPSKKIYEEIGLGKTYWQRFRLFDADRNQEVVQLPFHCITDDNKFEWNIDSQCGYIGFSADLASGFYFLVYSGENGEDRSIPIYIYQGWYTQLFLTVSSEPLFGSLRIFISKKKCFDPAEKYHVYTDICLCKLQNNDYSLDKNLIRHITTGKFDFPMLGLLGAYMYFKNKKTYDDTSFELIALFLRQHILQNSDSADIVALNILSYRQLGRFVGEKTLITRKQMHGTPMLRIAYDIICENASEYSWLVEKDSLNDYIVDYRMLDSSFNTITGPFANVLIRYLLGINGTTSGSVIPNPLHFAYYHNVEGFWIEDALSSKKEHLGDEDIFDYESILSKSDSLKNSFTHLEQAIINLLVEHEKGLSIKKIAHILKVPQTTVVRVLQGSLKFRT